MATRLRRGWYRQDHGASHARASHYRFWPRASRAHTGDITDAAHTSSNLRGIPRTHVRHSQSVGASHTHGRHEGSVIRGGASHVRTGDMRSFAISWTRGRGIPRTHGRHTPSNEKEAFSLGHPAHARATHLPTCANVTGAARFAWVPASPSTAPSGVSHALHGRNFRLAKP